MFNAQALLALHTRVHACMTRLMEQCEGFADEELHRPLDGFGYPTILEQIHHVIGAERYWVGVLQGKVLIDEHPEDHKDIDALRTYRSRVVEGTVEFLNTTSDDALSTTRSVQTWNKKDVPVVPAFVMLRLATHAFQHQGQVVAMARLLGRPVPPGLDFPLV